MTPLVSVCMVCRDRWELTRQALESLFTTVPLDRFMLCIVDDASSPENFAGLDAWLRKHDNERLHAIAFENTEAPRGVGGSKNFGIQGLIANAVAIPSLKTPYLFSCDNDIRFKPGWLETLIGAYEAAKSDYKLLGGYAHPFNGTNHRHAYGDYEIHEKNAVDGLSWFMEWETWHKYGPLDSHARGVRQSEDWALCQKIRNDGFKVGVVFPHVIENHGVLDTFGEKIPGAELVEKEFCANIENASRHHLGLKL